MKIKILVIDNEKPIRMAFLKMLKHVCDHNYEFHEAESVATGIKAMGVINPDILFLDIELDDGSGFDLLNAVDYSKVQLIFTTAHNQYAIKAFEYSAVNYLLKPISPIALQKVVQTATEKIGKEDVSKQIQVMLSAVKQPNYKEQKLVLKDANGIYFVNMIDILYCEASGPYTIFHFLDRVPIVISRNLGEYEHLLLDYKFARCHHGYLVNLMHISSIDKGDGNTLILKGDKKIPISVRKKEEIISMLNSMSIS
jgi:two-component system, LytTR family, response regulator